MITHPRPSDRLVPLEFLAFGPHPPPSCSSPKVPKAPVPAPPPLTKDSRPCPPPVSRSILATSTASSARPRWLAAASTGRKWRTSSSSWSMRASSPPMRRTRQKWLLPLLRPKSQWWLLLQKTALLARRRQPTVAAVVQDAGGSGCLSGPAAAAAAAGPLLVLVLVLEAPRLQQAPPHEGHLRSCLLHCILRCGSGHVISQCPRPLSYNILVPLHPVLSA